MFGKVREIPQTEKTPFYPRSVYGISKVAGFDLKVFQIQCFNLIERNPWMEYFLSCRELPMRLDRPLIRRELLES